MQLSNIPAKLLLAFAAAGGRNAIPVASQISTTPGAASFTDGFPPLTRTPIVAGGVPPSGLDMNGILYELSALLQWLNAGGGFPYDATFATDTNVNGYPKGARVMRSDGSGYWLNTVDGNEVDPESVTVGQAAAAGWVPDTVNGVASVTMTNANVTLTPAQYGKPIISLSGALTADLNLIFPAIAGEWIVVNNCTGNHTITAKTAGGGGVTISVGKHRMIYGDGTNIAATLTEGDTAAQFDSSSALATTQFVEAVGIQYSRVDIFAISSALTAANAGGLCVAFGNTGAINIQLPAANTLKNGVDISFLNASAYPVTILANGADLINPAVITQSSIVLQPGDTFSAATYGTIWECTGGSAALPYIAGFASAQSTSGYTKLPNGLIVQWGVVTSSGTSGGNATATLPIAFPNAFLWGGAAISGTGQLASNTVQVGVGTTTTLPMTTLSNGAITSAMTAFYLAIGR